MRDGLEIVDAHQHYGAVGDALSGVHPSGPSDVLDGDSADLQRRVQVLDDTGVDGTVIIASHSYLRPNGVADTRRVNDGLVAYRERTSNRVVAAVGVVEPLYGAAGLPEIVRCKEIGLAGISFHGRFQGVSHDSPWVHRFLERMGELSLVPFMHSAAGSPEEALWTVEGLALDFPDLTIIVLDALSRHEDCRAALRVAERAQNLVFDTAVNLDFEYVVPLVRRFGAHRVVYGSDLYSMRERPPGANVLDQILTAELDEAERSAILARNIKGLLRIA